jgi:hypothetical protein
VVLGCSTMYLNFDMPFDFEKKFVEFKEGINIYISFF